MAHKAGYVDNIGEPNVGKSTLLNALLGEQLVIVNPKAQTTRHRILGILNGDDHQLVLSDTPGILDPQYPMQERMMSAVEELRRGPLASTFRAGLRALASVNSPMQCMMKEVCGQCLQAHRDPATGRRSLVFSCAAQDQPLEEVDFGHLAGRLRQQGVGTRPPGDLLFRQNGRSVFREVCPLVSELILRQLAEAGRRPDELKRLWLHQANLGMNELISKFANVRCPAWTPCLTTSSCG